MIRITAGEWKGRSLATPPSLSTRPTQARLRQALFNSIQFGIPDAKVLDLFAGSGALAFEALSRGAADATLVENHRTALDAITKNLKELNPGPRARLVKEDVFKAESQVRRFGPFDFVFADPPFAEGYEMRLLEDLDWSALLVPGGQFLLEWGAKKSKIEAVPDETTHLEKIREKVYGDSVLTTYRRKDGESA
jgi:16S rRNA (guanine(966)-N(2))-methyltransferase RsmD